MRPKQTFKDGSSYEGQWLDNYRQGNGRYTWPSGAYYDGNWIDD